MHFVSLISLIGWLVPFSVVTMHFKHKHPAIECNSLHKILYFFYNYQAILNTLFILSKYNLITGIRDEIILDFKRLLENKQDAEYKNRLIEKNSSIYQTRTSDYPYIRGPITYKCNNKIR